jgi:protein-tyrosine-phosphatase
MMPSVLFVCTHNLCRSPLACALLQSMVAQRADAPDWHIGSAGTWARENEPATAGTQAAARLWGLDLSPHRSRCVSAELLASYNLVLTMEQGHKEALRIEFPALADRVYLLSEMGGAMLSVNDPSSDNSASVQRLLRNLDQWLQRGYDQIVQRACAAVTV